MSGLHREIDRFMCNFQVYANNVIQQSNPSSLSIEETIYMLKENVNRLIITNLEDSNLEYFFNWEYELEQQLMELRQSIEQKKIEEFNKIFLNLNLDPNNNHVDRNRN